MSKHNNVNPGQYKVAGRDRMGTPGLQDREKMADHTSARMKHEQQEPQAKPKGRPRARTDK